MASICAHPPPAADRRRGSSAAVTERRKRPRVVLMVVAVPAAVILHEREIVSTAPFSANSIGFSATKTALRAVAPAGSGVDAPGGFVLAVDGELDWPRHALLAASRRSSARAALSGASPKSAVALTSLTSAFLGPSSGLRPRR